MKNKIEKKKIVYKILATLEENHINLYHDITKEEVLKYIESVKNWDIMTDVQFDLEMLKIFALFKDSHTVYVVPNEPSSAKFNYIQGKFYILDSNKWKEITYFGTIKASEMRKKFEKIVGFETQEWLSHKIKMFIHNLYFYKMLKLNNGDKFELTLADGTKLEIHEMTEEEIMQWKPKAPYTFKVLDNNILYFQYRSCVDKKDYPFSKLMQDIIDAIEKNDIKEYILDLRDNTGGSSRVIQPFQELVKNKKLNGVLLINNATFSSGRHAAAKFKKEFNTPLIGEPTGGSTKAYGESGGLLEVENKHFSTSTSLCDFSEFFGYVGPIQPDILVKETIDDIQNKKDTILKTAVDYIVNHKTITITQV